jgi:hypothetical protein
MKIGDTVRFLCKGSLRNGLIGEVIGFNESGSICTIRLPAKGGTLRAPTHLFHVVLDARQEETPIEENWRDQYAKWKEENP